LSQTLIAQELIDSMKPSVPSRTYQLAKKLFLGEHSPLMDKSTFLARGRSSTLISMEDLEGTEYVLKQPDEKEEQEKSEFSIHKLFDHPNILGCYGQLEEGIVLEYANQQTLEDVLRLTNGCVLTGEEKLQNLKRYLYQAALALREVHAKGFIHMDVKEYNCLIKDGELKLADFDLSQKKGSERVVGTLLYMADEVGKGKASPKSDVWSLGVMFFHILTGQYPRVPEKAENKTLTFVRLRKMDPNFTILDRLPNEPYYEAAKDLIKKMLVRDVEERASIEEVLAHQFFSGLS
jgi:serine/threonine protein kinase